MLTKSRVPTPALLLDLDAFEENLGLMADWVRRCGKKLRPHFKAHKCIEIAKRQMAAGACGISAATVDELELLAKAAIPGLLLTSPVADPLKMARIAATGAMVVVDHEQQVEWYGKATAQKLDVLIDLDAGDHRTGVTDAARVLEIARAIAKWPSLRLRGLQAYSVGGSHGRDLEERRRLSGGAFRIAGDMKTLLEGAGFAIEIVTGGSTGTWEVDGALPEVTEMQAGSYVLMDLAYRQIGIDFSHAMTVLATVISANHAGFVTVDAGIKAFSTDRGYGPEALHPSAAGYRWGGDEFGFVDVKKAYPSPVLGERIEFVPPHCDPTMNLYDRIYACRRNGVEEVWPVMSRMRN